MLGKVEWGRPSRICSCTFARTKDRKACAAVHIAKGAGKLPKATAVIPAMNCKDQRGGQRMSKNDIDEDKTKEPDNEKKSKQFDSLDELTCVHWMCKTKTKCVHWIC